MTIPADPVVAWHDAECGAYTADLELWRGLAAAAGGPVLDIGAGTGRVALDLAARGFEVVALDLDGRLLAALSERAAAAGLAVETVKADAAGFELPGRRFGAIFVPMQTVQLLDGPEARAELLSAARRHLVPGGRLALALAPRIQAFEPSSGALPEPDVLRREGVTFVSQPVGVRREGAVIRLERVREIRQGETVLHRERDSLALAPLDAVDLAAEAEAAGFTADRLVPIGETDRHVGSEVVVLRA